MPEFSNTEKFDIKKLPRLEIIKPMDRQMRIFIIIFCVVIPVGVLMRGIRDNMITAGNAMFAVLGYTALVASIYFGVKRYFVLDRTRNGLFRVTHIFGSLNEKYLCGLADISCVAVDSHERTTKNGGGTGQFWYESCLILKNKRVIRLHRTFEDSYDEIQDAEQYAEYLGCRFFGPKPGLEMKVINAPDGATVVEFTR